MLYNDECDCLMWDRCCCPSRPLYVAQSSDRVHACMTMDTKEPKGTPGQSVPSTPKSAETDAPKGPSTSTTTTTTTTPATKDIGSHEGSTNAATTRGNK